jgi:hypothetical protein
LRKIYLSIFYKRLNFMFFENEIKVCLKIYKKNNFQF